MANQEMKMLKINAENGSFSFEVVDETARSGTGTGGSGPIIYHESLDRSNPAFLRDLASGSYVLYGYYKPFNGSSTNLTFDGLLANVVNISAGSHILVFSTLNSKVDFLAIEVDSTQTSGYKYQRTSMSLLDLNALIERVSTLENLLTTAERVADITLLAANWVGEASPYSQVVEIEGITPYSQVDLTPSVEQLVVFHEKDLTFVTEQENGVVTVYAIGQKPENDYTIQVTITEVSA